MTQVSKFKFNSCIINRSLIEFDKNSDDRKLKLAFKPSGEVKQKENLFILHLSVIISNEVNDLKVEVDAVGEFEFDEMNNEKEINSLFYNNAPAILFPYIRAYISTLTNLSGIKNIILPTMNLSDLADELKKNTSFK